jgi:hypothetical protein
MICTDLALKSSDLAFNMSKIFPMKIQHVQDMYIMHKSCPVSADHIMNTSYIADLC